MESFGQIDATSAVLHRRPAYGVNGPVAICHLCFRSDEITAAPSAKLAAIKRNIAIVDLNTALFRIQNACRNDTHPCEAYLFRPHNLNPAIFSASQTNEEATAHDTLVERTRALDEQISSRRCAAHRVGPDHTILSLLPKIDSKLRGWRARMRVDVHSEYYSVTFVLDQKEEDQTANEPAAGPDRQNDHQAANSNDTTSSKGDFFDAARIRNIECDLSAQQGRMSEEDAFQYVNSWYEAIWAAFFGHIKAVAGEISFPGTKFAEFRGLAMNKAPTKPVGSFAGANARTHDAIVAGPRMTHQLRKSKTELCDWLNQNRELMRSILQFDRLAKDKDQDANCVLCTVLDGRGIYASSLGQIEPIAPEQGEASKSRELNDKEHAKLRPPLRYFVLHDGLSRFQLGRLLRRFHVLGELRSAAVLDLARLSEASERIRALGNEIDNRLRTPEPERDKPSLPRETLNDAQGRLNEVTSSRISGGLTYRISRSRHYARDFKVRMSDMLFERLEGWEPYDAFMHRNLFPVLDYIDGIGMRFEALQARMQRLTLAHNAERLNDFQDNIEALVERMTEINTEVRDVQMDIKKVQEKILDIQLLSEAIGVGAFAYYGGHIIATFIKTLMKIFFLIRAEQAHGEEILKQFGEIIELGGMVAALVILPKLWSLWKRNRLPTVSGTAATSK